MSPTQSSVLLLAVNTPSGPEVSLSPVKPCELRVEELCDVWIVPRINDVDRLVVAVSQEVLVEHRIEPADVKRKERLGPLGGFQSRYCLVQKRS